MRRACKMMLAAAVALFSATLAEEVSVDALFAQLHQNIQKASLGSAVTTERRDEANRLSKVKETDESLVGAYQAVRYRVQRAEDSLLPEGTVWHAWNPAQHLTTNFTSNAVHLTASDPSGAAHAVVLRLTGYGYGDNVQPPSLAEPIANENRVEYHRGSLTEWYVNDSTGLEQGFTLAEPLSGRTSESPLILTMATETALQPRLTGADQIQFVDSTNRARLQYSQLKAWDAAGRELSADIQTREDGIVLLIDDSGARYPVTVDPLIFSEAKIIAGDGSSGDEFGATVAISGDTAVIGAPLDDEPPMCCSELDHGSIYVFVRSGGVWTLQQKLTASDQAYQNRFGAVAISDDTIVVGTYANNTAITLHAYVYVRSGGVWTEQQKLFPSDPLPGGILTSITVAVDGNTAVLGTPTYSDVGAGLGNVGAAYMFVRSGGTWTQQQKLTASDGASSDAFGYSVGISGNTAIVGANRHNHNNSTGSLAGAAYVFVRSGSVWTQQQELLASDEGMNTQFGFSVGISGNTAIVGTLQSAGAAYIFQSSGGLWSEQQKLTSSDGVASDQFGRSVAISADVAVVSAPFHDSQAGSAYVFVRSGVVWTQQAELTAIDPTAGKLFGYWLGIGGDTIIVGAPGDSLSVGAAYIYVDATAADLILGLTADKAILKWGDTLTYTITVKNFGPNRAFKTVVNDVLSSDMLFVSASANKGSFTTPSVGKSGTVTWSLGELLPTGEEAAQIAVTVIAGPKATITNTATIQSTTADPNLINNIASITTTVKPGNGNGNGNGKGN